MRLYRFNKEKPRNIADKSVNILRCTVLCSLGFAFINKYFLNETIAYIFLKGALFYTVIGIIASIFNLITVIKEILSAKKNGIELILFWKTTDIVKSFKGRSLESLLSKYDGYYEYEGENVICIYNQFRFKLLIDSNHIVKEVLLGHNVSELSWLDKRIRELHIQTENGTRT